MRRKAKVTNEVQKQPLSPEAQDIKQAIQQTQSHPIEQVIFVHAPVADEHDFLQHERLTNRYTFKYPETWRTIPNSELSIGVRGIHLRHSEAIVYRVKAIPGQFYVPYKSVFQWYPDLGFELEKVVYVNEEPNFASWCDLLNAWVRQLYDEEAIPSELFPKNNLSVNKWTYEYDSYTKTCRFHQVREAKEEQPAEIKFQLIWKFENISRELKRHFEVLANGEIFDPLQMPDKYSDDMEFRFQGSWTPYSQYLIAASFVGQSRRNYLGFTGTQFNPPKIYKVPSGDVHFHIDLYSADGLEERELPEDYTDFIAIEIQLMSQPLSNRL